MFFPNCGMRNPNAAQTPGGGTAPGKKPGPLSPDRKQTGFSRGLTLGVIGAVAAVALIAVLLAVFVFPTRSGVEERRFASPEEYSEFVLNGGIESLSGAAAEVYDRRFKTDMDLNDFHQDLKLTLRLGDGCARLLRESTGEDFSWLNSAALNLGLDRSLGEVFLSLSAVLNDRELLRGEALADLEAQELAVQVPSVSERWFSVPMEELLNALPETYQYALDEGLYTESLQLAAPYYDALPDRDAIERLLKKYLEMAAGALQNMTKGEGSLTAAEVTAPCATLTYTVTSESLESALRNIYTAMETDPDLEALIRYIGQTVGSATAYDDFTEALSEELAKEKPVRLAGDVNLTLWVDEASGSLRGMELRQESADWTVNAAFPRDGDSLGLEIACRKDLSEEQEQAPQFLFAGAGSLEGDRFSGSFTAAEAGEELMGVEVKELDLAALRQGNFQGVITLRPTREFWARNMDGVYTARLLEGFSLELETHTEGAHAAASWRILDGEDFFAGLEMSADAGVSRGISSRPEDSATPEDWLMDVLTGGGLSAYVEGLYETDIPEEYVESLSMLVARTVYLYTLQGM